MELQLKNIGMIKEANVKIDGLTVIAGENDTGKSTVGKVFYVVLKSLKETYSNELMMGKKANDFIAYMNIYFSKIFKEQLFPKNAFILFEEMEYKASIYVEYSTISSNLSDDEYIKKDIIFIETPLVWNFTDFFRDIAQVESQMEIKLDYPYLMKDLNFKLHIKSALDGLDIKEKVTSLMGGEFKKDDMGRYYFDKQGQRIELVNTATGIKYFGIFQVLSQNNYLNENTVLVLDEPEVHLHPKWQLEMAKIIVELVKNGVKIVVNSHSPYMIQALIKYARDKDIVDKSNFYLSEKVDDYAVINNVNDELNKIFELLAEPMNEVFEL